MYLSLHNAILHASLKIHSIPKKKKKKNCLVLLFVPIRRDPPVESWGQKNKIFQRRECGYFAGWIWIFKADSLILGWEMVRLIWDILRCLLAVSTDPTGNTGVSPDHATPVAVSQIFSAFCQKCINKCGIATGTDQGFWSGLTRSSGFSVVIWISLKLEPEQFFLHIEPEKRGTVSIALRKENISNTIFGNNKHPVAPVSKSIQKMTTRLQRKNKPGSLFLRPLASPGGGTRFWNAVFGKLFISSPRGLGQI